MASLRNPSTKHEIKTDDKSVEFWVAAGYEEIKAPAKKVAAKSNTKK